MIRTFADLVVRVRVQWTSPDRPDSDDLSDFRGTDLLRLGSGSLHYAIDPSFDGPCPCRECNGTQTKQRWTFAVLTACHVVYNTEEAIRTKVDVFYDDKSDVQNGKMQTLWGVKAVWSNADRDVCQLLCVTHDAVLAERIRALECGWRSLYKYYKLFGQSKRERKDNVKAIIFSHPHGQPKKMTVGNWVHNGDGSVKNSNLEYHTATCPGSSGAPVLLLSPTFFETSFFPWTGPVHSGALNKTSRRSRKQVNYSSL